MHAMRNDASRKRRSHARLTYNQVNEMLTDNNSALRNEYEQVLPHVETLYKLYKVLADARGKRGVIEFESNETHIVFDDNKKIKEIVPIVRNDAHKLIEECMILANVAAAAYLEQNKIPTLYRWVAATGPLQWTTLRLSRR